jgi:ankyrin repeat protein
LLKHDADVNATDKYKQTPLDRCCSKGNISIVELLLKHPKTDLSMHKECDGDHSLFSK